MAQGHSCAVFAFLSVNAEIIPKYQLEKDKISSDPTNNYRKAA